MAFLVHIFLFLVATGIIWFFAGILINSVDRIAKHFNKTSFTVAFFVLGFLTSISEISVAVNSTINHVPQISAGNLVGASFVILLLLIPLLAIAGNGVTLRHTLSRRNLLVTLGLILLPSLFVVDGNVNRAEGTLLVLAYITLLYLIKSDRGPLKEVKAIEADLLEHTHTAWDWTKVVVGAVLIFIAGHYLVEQATFFADALSVPRSLMGLLLLSIGTNVPELAIAFRSIFGRHKEVAFGDYLGSAMTNVPIFGLLPLLNGTFRVEPSEFLMTTLLMAAGLISFYIFAGTRDKISRREGFVLLGFYGVFILMQAMNLARFAADQI